MEWLMQLASELDVDPIEEGRQSDLLDVARDVAHRTERKATPLASYLLGEAVGRRIAAGQDPEEAFAAALTDLRRALESA